MKYSKLSNCRPKDFVKFCFISSLSQETLSPQQIILSKLSLAKTLGVFSAESPCKQTFLAFPLKVCNCMVNFFLFFEQLDNVFAKCHRKEAVHSSSFPITATIYFEPNKHNPIANCKLQQMRGKNASVPALEYNPLTYMFVYMAANHYFAYEVMFKLFSGHY